MKSICINKDWQFYLGDCPGAWEKRYVAQGWEDVTLPHDWSVTQPFSKEYSSGTGYLAGGIGWYRKFFRLPEEYRGKKIKIAFDGVYKNSQVWVNGYYLGKRPNGYVPFEYDISDRVSFGDDLNLISVKVTHTDIADSRWFTGSGITRGVKINVFENVFVCPQSIFFKTLSANEESAQIEIDADITNALNESVSVDVEAVLTDENGAHAAQFSKVLDVVDSERARLTFSGTVAHPKLWSVDSPNLYTLKITTSVGHAEHSMKESADICVGIRTFEFHPEKGFFLNGQSLKMKGVCVHHDAGCLGAAVLPEVWERRLEKLKQMGCNAIRTSHNPAMSELYDLCDRMGFLMMDEAFDEWEGAKNKWTRGHNVYPPVHQGYFEDFPQWHKKDLEAMLYRGRNHPSIVIWSVGNEIDYPNDPYCHQLFSEMTGNNDKNKPEAERMYDPRRPNAERLLPVAKRLMDIVRCVDPTRPVTIASAFPELSVKIGLIDIFDVICYNYKEHLYSEAHEKYKDKSVLGSENSHRYKDWRAVTDNDYVCGQFLWTGIDFLGEAHGWPIRGSKAGHMTLAGFEKPSYYSRLSMWAQKPVIKILTKRADGQPDGWAFDTEDTWNYIPGEAVEIRAYTNMPSAEVSVNGHSLGKKGNDYELGYISWIVSYEKGMAEALAYDNAGEAVADDMICTNGAACKLSLEVWTPKLYARDSIEQVEVTLLDENDVRVSEGAAMLFVEAEGDAQILGIENGDQSDLTEYSAKYRKAYKGKLLVYVRKNSADSVTLKVRGEGVAEAKIQI